MEEGFSIDELKKIIHICGLLHDIGKYAYEFQKHIKGADLRVEHSICGAKEAERLLNKNSPLALLVSFALRVTRQGLT